MKIFNRKSPVNTTRNHHTSLEKKVDQLLTPFQKYIDGQASAAVFLLACTATALIWASIPSLSGSYLNFINIPIGFHVAHYHIDKALSFWVNDILLTLFFFYAGLEIKREFLVGEIGEYKQAFFVIFCAVGGMLVPATLYWLFNANTHSQIGWGIAMPTDTAFTIGLLTCFRHKIPKKMFSFIAALAIIDDIGSILVIAIFYTDQINPYRLFIAAIFTTLLVLMNYSGFRKPLPYLIVGLCLWFCIESAGIHGVISGVLIAFCIPARPKQKPSQFIDKAHNLIEKFGDEESIIMLESPDKHNVLEEIQQEAKQSTTPLQAMETRLEKPISLMVLPLFALVNAGISLNLSLLPQIFTHRYSLGILFGLVVGKPLGIFIFIQLARLLKIGIMLNDICMKEILGPIILTGIGFTMSLFMARLVFTDPSTLLITKASIILSSVISGLLGVSYLLF